MAGASDSETRLHATCVAVDGRGALLLGPSGAGKSDLALRMITGQFCLGDRIVKVRLVADDQVEVTRQDRRLLARAPAAIAGRIEARGVGIIDMSYAPEAQLVLAADLVTSGQVERIPEARHFEILGVAVPLITLDPFEASASSKLMLALLNPGQCDVAL